MIGSSSVTLAPFNPSVRSVWILTTQIKKMGPNISIWAPRIETDDSSVTEPYEPPFVRHDRILGESRLGPSPMTIIENPRIMLTESLASRPEYRFVRRLTEGDEPKLLSLAERESSLLSFVRERAGARDLPMLFMDAVGNFAANDFLLYYTAEGRVDFRDLLKDIHGKYRGRVELRQISPREYTSVLDGMGACGKTLCCSSFLKSFKTVSSKTARESASDSKSNGMCGRLKCCASFDSGPSTGSAQAGSGEGGGSCCSKKSQAKEADWIPMTSFMTPAVPSAKDGGPDRNSPPGGTRISGHPPRRTEKMVSRTENRFRKDSPPRG